ncbi:MAG TPA: hypothetical protein VGJ20_22880 [Xanthobacteraceae bacterium]
MFFVVVSPNERDDFCAYAPKASTLHGRPRYLIIAVVTQPW